MAAASRAAAILRSKESDFFSAEIDASHGLLGLKLGEDGVTVAMVDRGGLVDQWNAVHSCQITPGVEVRAVNGSWNPIKMSEELRQAKALKFDIWKPRSKRTEVEAADNALGAEPIMLLQQRINLEGKKRDEAIEQLTAFMTDAIKTVSNRMEELALTHSKGQQQQDYAMQRMHAMDETISDMRESERAQILQLKRLEEIQSNATEQISQVKAEQEQLLNRLGKLSSETKVCIGQLNDSLRGIVEDVASLDFCKAKLPTHNWDDESDSDANVPTPSDQTVILPRKADSQRHEYRVTETQVASDPQKRCSQPKVDPIPNFTQCAQWPLARQSSPVPLRPLQNLSANCKPEKPPIISGAFPRNDLGEVPQMVSPRPASQPVNWTMSTPRLTHTTSPMPSPRFAPSPQRSPRVAVSNPQQLQSIQSFQPPIIKAWQMRPVRNVEHPSSLKGPCQVMNVMNASPREALQQDSNIPKLMTPRLEKSLPATERSRRVTSPTRSDPVADCG